MKKSAREGLSIIYDSNCIICKIFERLRRFAPQILDHFGASMAEWLESSARNHLLLTAVGSIGAKTYHVGKPSSWLADGRWF